MLDQKEYQLLQSSYLGDDEEDNQSDQDDGDGYGKIQTFIIVRTRQNNGHALGKEVVG